MVAIRLAALMFLNYGLNALSFRFLAHNNYLGVALTDFVIPWYGFAMVKLIIDAKLWYERMAYAVGGMLGSLLAMWLTR